MASTFSFTSLFKFFPLVICVYLFDLTVTDVFGTAASFSLCDYASFVLL